MRTHLRILVLLARPPVVILLALFTAVGQVHAAGGERPWRLAPALLVGMAYLVFSVAMNDMSDVAVDRVNLPGDRRRPLASVLCSARDMGVVAAAAGATMLLGAALLLKGAAVPIMLGALALSAAYSLPPLRIAKRGALASLLLPAGYVVVPYCAGVLSISPALHLDDALVLAGLYLAFVGRILLKDFRDVRGDTLFGKRTFLVRHGRRATCAMSAGFWTVGAAVIAAVRPQPASAASFLVLLAPALLLLRLLASDGSARRDERLISALAIVGRGSLVVLLAHLSCVGARTPVAPRMALTVGLTMIILAEVHRMAAQGPRTSLTVPADWHDVAAQRPEPQSVHPGSSSRLQLRDP